MGADFECAQETEKPRVELNLSRAQAKYCGNHGLEAVVKDWKEGDPKTLARFDGVISMGAFGHFCSPEEFERGEQERIYEKFFDFCADVCLTTDGCFSKRCCSIRSSRTADWRESLNQRERECTNGVKLWPRLGGAAYVERVSDRPR